MGKHADDEDRTEMSDFEAFDLDRATGRAWSQFQARLGVHLAEMGDDDALVVSVESADEDETGPYVQFLTTDAGIHTEASSNQYLTGPHRLSARAEAELADLGLTPPTCAPGEEPAEGGSANHFTLAARADADRLAVTAVRVLRRVFDVPHPAFLEADGLFDDDPTSAADHLDQSMQAVVPRSRDHLLELVDEALTPVFGHVPEHDDDGDIPVVSGSSLVFVRVHERTPTIELLASVVSDIEDLALARFEVGVLNRSAGEIAWREHRDLALLEGDDDEAEVAGIELAAAERTGSLLRRALRVVAEAELADRHQSSGGKPRYRRRSRSEEPPSLFDDDTPD